MNTTTPHWIDAIPSNELAAGSHRPFRHGAHRLLLVRTDDGALSATDALCPHEGYPLVQGHLKDCVLTCAWHNFKFDVRSGKAVMGDEAVATYAVRERDGRVQVDLQPADPHAEIARRLTALENGLHRARLGQAVRDTVRLLKAGMTAEDLAVFAVAVAYERSEYGGTHAPALALDLLGYLPRYPGIQAALPLAQLMELVVESVRGLPRHPAVPASEDIDDDSLLNLVEEERGAAAQAALSARIASRGTSREWFEPLFMRLAASHFLDFGHATIYASKLFDLLDRASAAIRQTHAPTILAGFLRMVLNGTREDTLPPWKLAARALSTWGEDLDGLWRQNRQVETSVALPELTSALVDGKPSFMLETLRGALEAGVGLRSVANALMVASSERLRRFDPAVDADPTVREGWLFVTHTFTHAEAVRLLVDRLDHVDILRHIVFGAFFLNHYRPLDRADTTTPPPTATATPAGLLAGIAQGDAAGAEAQIRGLLDAPDAIEATLLDLPLDDVVVRPIVTAHLVKGIVAAFSAYRQLLAANHPQAALPLAAAVRFLAGPIRERPTRRLVEEAIRLVAEGRTPQRLVS